MSIITEIIDWVKDKPPFQQEAVGRILQKNILSENDFLDLIEICKSEKRLVKYSKRLVNLEKLKESIEESESVGNISILKISNTENINALKNNSEVIIEDNGLTVIYGDNGSGKSSYVSVLKQVCNTRGNIPTIHRNLFLDSTASQNQKAKIQYKIRGDTDFVNWENGDCDSKILKAVHIFDTKSASSYIEEEDEIAFTPSGLLIIEKLANACNKVEENIKEKVERLELKKFDFSFLLTGEDSDIQTFIKNLSSESDFKKLEEIAVFTVEDNKLLEATEREIAKLKTLDPTKKITENNKIIARFNALKTRYEQITTRLSTEKVGEIKKDILKQIELRSTIKILIEKTFLDLPLEEIGSPSWKTLWESAKKFYELSTKKNFPDSNEEVICPLCLQNLDDEAKNRFTNFESFVQTDIQTQLNTVNYRLCTLKQNIESINLDFSEIQATIAELNDINKNFEDQHDKIIETISSYKTSILKLFTNSQKVNKFVVQGININLINTITEITEKIKEENKVLLKKSVSEELEDQNKILSLLKSQKDLFENKEKIINEIKRQKNVEVLNLCISSCNTRNISLFSNSLSEKYVTETLKENFVDELKKLGFSNIKITPSTRGSGGKQYHSLELNSSYGSNIRLNEILSEGEHRCISLATFLSELSVCEHKSSIIFDDPVSSLDHKWRKKIAERIIEEADERQVIIFTHDITFLMNLQELSSANINIQSLTNRGNEKGIPLECGPWDGLKTTKRIGILKQFFQDLEKIKRTETEEDYKEQSKIFYGKLRETWERCIEEVVLNQTVQRFGRSVQTQKLKLVTDLTEDDYKIIENNMKKCSTYFSGHDTAGELIEEPPSIDDIKNDLNILDEFRKAIIQRREK